ncbi:hypothetical protein PBI_SCTP2_352 [Salicola phage SCTP-2]|nr:hypothetical protein PBI_SCTP2_352 [Salicola phage SCTP-2]
MSNKENIAYSVENEGLKRR